MFRNIHGCYFFPKQRKEEFCMNMKRVFALLLTLAMALSLAACGTNKEEAPAEAPAAETPARSAWVWSAPTLPTTGRRILPPT